MTAADEPMTILSESESWDLLKSQSLGRLVTVAGGEPEIFPVNFVVDHRTVLFRTAAGTKLASAAISGRVLFEVDEHNVAEGWSVIVRGIARVLQMRNEVKEAEQAQLLPWTAMRKQHYVRVIPTQITGRRFVFGPEPDRD